MTQRIIISVLAVVYCFTVHASDRELSLSGHVKDSFTHGGIYDVTLYLMNEDSVVIDSQKVQYLHKGKTYMDSYYRFKIPSVQRKYVLMATHEDYDTCFVSIEIKYIARNTNFDAPILYMKRKILQGSMLDEVVVKATKVKFFCKGDTIIYNADALVLPNGSMLDDLVRQLPGARLTPDGEIFVNGRKIDELMLHGKHFFSKNRSSILKNMPAYIVKNISFYEFTSDKDKYLGHQTEEKKYVMDLLLKKEYAKGYIANATLGYGNRSRFIGRLFGLRYTPHSRISLFGNANNVREYLRPGSDGEWRVSNINDVQLLTKSGGLEYFWTDNEEKIKNTFQVGVDSKFGETEILKVTENYLSTMTNLIRSDVKGKLKDIYLYADNRLTIKAPLLIRMSVGGTYRKSDSNNNTWSKTYRLGGSDNDSILNRHYMQENGNGFRVELYENLEAIKKLPWGDHFAFTANANYRTSKNSTINHHYVWYQLNNQEMIRDLSDSAPSNRGFIEIASEYSMFFPNNLNFSFKYTFEHEKEHEINDIYRTDRVNSDTLQIFQNHEELPSERDSILMTFDATNSFNSTYKNRKYKAIFHTSYQKKGRWLDAMLQLCYNVDRLHYSQSVLDTIVSRNKWLIRPSLSFKLTPKNGCQLDLKYMMETKLPDLRKTISVANTQMPLVTYVGNNKLSSTRIHDLHLSFRDRIKTRGFYNFTINVTLYKGKIGNAMKVTSNTGAYTYQPRNIDGNYRAKCSASLSIAVDRKKRWTLDNGLSCTYNRNVDYIAENTGDYNLCKADNYYIDEFMKLSWQKNSLRCCVLANIKWHKQISRNNFSRNVSVLDVGYAVNITYTFPWKYSLSTDVRLSSLYGYSEASYNRNYLIWNISLKKDFLKERLNVGFVAYDLLHQLSPYDVVVNAQGKEEKFYKVITNYFMLTVGYKFQKKP